MLSVSMTLSDPESDFKVAILSDLCKKILQLPTTVTVS